MIVSILLGFMVLGIWLVASLNGGITSLDNSENMANFFQKLVVTLNPLDRIKSNNSHFYYGLAACIIAVCGIFLGYKKSRAGFVTAVVILVCTTTAMYPVLLSSRKPVSLDVKIYFHSIMLYIVQLS